MNSKALKDVKVLDFTHYISGPYCTKLLGDYGADVIKIERPIKGDPCRKLPPFEEAKESPQTSLLFKYLNTNKRSVELDLKSDFGRKAIEQLAVDTDILVENFRPGVLSSFGLTKQKLRNINPNLVVVSISNFGQTGPYSEFKANDLILYALGGLMYIFGSTEKAPIKHAFRQAQFKAGTNAASAALMGYYNSLTSGRGEEIDISIQESISASVRDATTSYATSGVVRTRQSPMKGEIPRTPIEVRDGYVVPITFGSTDWSKTADLLEEEKLYNDKFITPEGRRENADEFEQLVRTAFSFRGKHELFYGAHSHRELVYGLVQDAADLLENPQYLHDRYFQKLEESSSSKTQFPGRPFHLSKTPWEIRTAAPRLGQHNDEILMEKLKLSTEYPIDTGCSDGK
ncbi:MAG: CaiB/BaiF CoA transferase family protein [Dehalococcoidia bacterium]